MDIPSHARQASSARSRRHRVSTAALGLIRSVARSGNRLVFGLLVLSVALSFAASVFQALAPVLFSQAIDIFSAEDRSLPQGAVFLVMASLAAFGLSRLLVEQRWLVYQPAENRILNDIREVYLRHVLSLPLHFHLDRSIGRLDSIVGQGMAGIQTLSGLVFTQLSPLIFELVVTFVAMVGFVDGSISILVFSTVAAYLVILVFGAEWVSRRLKTALGASVDAQGVSGDAILNAEGIRMLAIENEIAASYREKLDAVHARFRRFYRSRGVLGLGLSAVLIAGFAVALWMAVSDVIAGRLSVGALVLTNTYILQLFRTMESFSFSYRDTRQSIEAVKRFLRLFNEPAEPAQDGLPPAEGFGTVELRGVGFRYPDGRWAVRNAGLRIERGRIAALLGPSGSGKSTIVRLILKMLQPTEGSICVDGVELLWLDGASMRRNVSVVPQDAIMFRASLAFNVALTNEPDRARLERAIRAAGLESMLETLPQGVDTEIGERGLKLSGGERQRLAIARAIYRGAGLFIFDEATSALDERTRDEILRLIGGLSPHYAVLLITHDKAVAAIADSIVSLRAPRDANMGEGMPDLEAAGQGP